MAMDRRDTQDKASGSGRAPASAALTAPPLDSGLAAARRLRRLASHSAPSGNRTSCRHRTALPRHSPEPCSATPQPTPASTASRYRPNVAHDVVDTFLEPAFPAAQPVVQIDRPLRHGWINYVMPGPQPRIVVLVQAWRWSPRLIVRALAATVRAATLHRGHPSAP